MTSNPTFLFTLLSMSLVLLVPLEVESVFAEKTVTIQKTVDVDKPLLIDSITNLNQYSQILPKYIQSSKIIDDNVGNMKIGLDWISIDTDVKLFTTNDQIILEVISGDFKGTKLYIAMTEIDDTLSNKKTDISATIDLKRSWHMELLTSFVSDDDVKSMLNTSLDGLVKYTKNPTVSKNIIDEKEKFCIFGLCF